MSKKPVIQNRIFTEQEQKQLSLPLTNTLSWDNGNQPSKKQPELSDLKRFKNTSLFAKARFSK